MLSDPVQRMIYDEIHGYALTAINPFLDDSSPKDHAFVDEFSCIGMNELALLVEYAIFFFCLGKRRKWTGIWFFPKLIYEPTNGLQMLYLPPMKGFFTLY